LLLSHGTHSPHSSSATSMLERSPVTSVPQRGCFSFFAERVRQAAARGHRHHRMPRGRLRRPSRVCSSIRERRLLPKAHCRCPSLADQTRNSRWVDQLPIHAIAIRR
jgi:hypothetical protein